MKKHYARHGLVLLTLSSLTLGYATPILAVSPTSQSQKSSAKTDEISNLQTYSADGKQLLNNLTDNNQITSNNLSSFRIYAKDKASDQIFSLHSLKLYAPQNSFKQVTIKIATHERYDHELTPIQTFDNLTWKQDSLGSYVELNLTTPLISYGYEVSLDQTTTLTDVKCTGQYFTNNILQDATATLDGQPFDAQNLTDNSINTTQDFDTSSNTSKTLEFTLADGQIYQLQSVLLAMNFPKDQGIKTITVSYFKDGQWHSLPQQTPSYQTNDQRREFIQLDLQGITTNKLRFQLDFNNSFGHGNLSEIQLIGQKTPSALALANLLDHVDPLTASTSTLTTTWLKNIDSNFTDKYTVSLAKTSNPSVINQAGQVTHMSTPQEVTLQYNVTDKKNNLSYLSPEFKVTIPAAINDGYTYTALPIDQTTAYQNPAMGWVAYVEGFECSVHNRYNDGKADQITNPNAQNTGLCLELDHPEDVAKYWQEMDQLIQQGMPINILYIREPWSWFEPKEGQYAWNDPNSILSLLVKGAKQRNIQLAFRVLTCSASCGQQATPDFVFDAGAKSELKDAGYIGNAKEPYIDDPIFKTKFQTFLNAFGHEFNNEQTAFVDANGLGEWGEQNNLVFTTGDKNQAVNTLMDYYVAAFPNVLLGGQQGSSQGSQAIANGFDTNGKNFVVRRDAFGSDKYLRASGNADQIKQYRQQGIPVFAENCYHHFQSRAFRWSSVIDYPDGGGVNEYGGDDPFITMQDMMHKVVNDALDLGANTIDLRVLEDCKLWMRVGQKYLHDFTQNGGYRITATQAKFNSTVTTNGTLNLTTTWQNNGVGILPNKNKRWDNKMKVAYALIDQNNQIVQTQMIDSATFNPGDFEKGHDYTNQVSFKLADNIKPGTYRLATAILNTRNQNQIGVQLASLGTKINNGWLQLGQIQVK